MKTLIKRGIFCLILLAVLPLSASALRPGDVAGTVLSTDIRAFIDGYEIPSYNIDGHLGIVAEDLCAYGFTVEYDDSTRTLSLNRTGGAIRGVAIPPTAGLPSGTPLMRVLVSDIRVYLDGAEVDGYNIDGRTIILFSSLDRYGTRTYIAGAALSMIETQPSPQSSAVSLPQRVIHGGGELGGFAGGNSLEAIDAAYSAGHRFIELDFLLSLDGHPVCLHDWSSYYAANIPDGAAMTREDFLKVKIYGRYTPLDIDSLAAWMLKHEDAFIITDVKDDNIGALRAIASACPALQGRFIPQIYSYDEYAPVRALGYTNIILTLYRLGEYKDKINTARIVPFAARRGLVAVTADFTIASKDFIAAFNLAGVPLAVHTVNDRERQEALLAAGVTSVYTDVINR